jgi:hypothetical protein
VPASALLTPTKTPCHWHCTRQRLGDGIHQHAAGTVLHSHSPPPDRSPTAQHETRLTSPRGATISMRPIGNCFGPSPSRIAQSPLPRISSLHLQERPAVARKHHDRPNHQRGKITSMTKTTVVDRAMIHQLCVRREARVASRLRKDLRLSAAVLREMLAHGLTQRV